jgi:hypothetical protein
VSGHGIDAFSAGVQTFRAYHCLVAISGNVDRPGGNFRMRTPKGFRNYGDLLHMPEFRLDEATEKRTIGADRFPLWAGPKGWQTACHNPSVIEAMLTGAPTRCAFISGVNILVTYPNTRRMMHAALARLPAVAAHAMTPRRSSLTSAAQDDHARGGGGVVHASGPTVLFTRAVALPQGEARLRSTSPCRCRRRWRSGRPSPSISCPALQRVQHPPGQFRHPYRGPGTQRLRPGARAVADRRSRRRRARSSCTNDHGEPGLTHCRPTPCRAASACRKRWRGGPLVPVTGDEKS